MRKSDVSALFLQRHGGDIGKRVELENKEEQEDEET